MSTEGAFASVILGGVQFLADPRGFEPYQRARRTNHRVIGTTVVQDFGVLAKDLIITLQSGDTGPMDTQTMKEVDALYRQTGVTFAYQDGAGTVGTVVLLDFRKSHRVAGLWDYTLVCKVETLTKLYGDTYVGG